jgi:hypothetical protein
MTINVDLKRDGSQYKLIIRQEVEIMRDGKWVWVREDQVKDTILEANGEKTFCVFDGKRLVIEEVHE